MVTSLHLPPELWCATCSNSMARLDRPLFALFWQRLLSAGVRTADGEEVRGVRSPYDTVSVSVVVLLEEGGRRPVQAVRQACALRDPCLTCMAGMGDARGSLLAAAGNSPAACLLTWLAAGGLLLCAHQAAHRLCREQTRGWACKGVGPRPVLRFGWGGGATGCRGMQWVRHARGSSPCSGCCTGWCVRDASARLRALAGADMQTGAAFQHGVNNLKQTQVEPCYAQLPSR